MKKYLFYSAITILLVLLILFLLSYFNIVGITPKSTIEHLKVEIKNNPYSIDLNYKLAEKYLEQGDVENYESQIKLLKKLSPHSYLYPTKLGDHFFKQGQYNISLSYYKEALELIQDSDSLLYFKIGNCYTNLDNNKEAIKYYRLQLQILSENKTQNNKMKQFIESLIKKLENNL